MGYPTTERHKILENAVAEQSYQIDRGLFSEDKVFHGVIQEIVRESEFDYCYLQVCPFPPGTPAQAGDLQFMDLGDDPGEDIPDNSRYVKVYVLNLPLEAVQAYYQVGQIVTYWHYSGQTDQTQIIRGSYVTLWVDHGQHLVKITSTANGSGTYNGKRMQFVGTVGPAANTDDLSLPLPNTAMPSEEDCIVLNTLENGLTASHWIPLNTWAIGLAVGVTDFQIGTDELPAIAVTIPQPPTVVKIGTSSSGDASGVYTSANIETGSASDFPPTGMSDGPACIVYNEVEKGLTAGGANVHFLQSGSCWPGVVCGADNTGKPRVLISAPIPLEVDLTTDGGSNGSVSGSTVTNASYTYTVKDIYGNTLATTVSPTWTRPQGILVGAATHGQIYFDSTGAMKLGCTDEQIKVVGCS